MARPPADSIRPDLDARFRRSAPLKLVVRLELRGRGDVQVFRVRLPGPESPKASREDARVEVLLSRSHFNQLVEKGKLRHWRDAYETARSRSRATPRS